MCDNRYTHACEKVRAKYVGLKLRTSQGTGRNVYLFLIFKNIGHHFNCSSVISNKQDIAQN